MDDGPCDTPAKNINMQAPYIPVRVIVIVDVSLCRALWRRPCGATSAAWRQRYSFMEYSGTGTSTVGYRTSSAHVLVRVRQTLS